MVSLNPFSPTNEKMNVPHTRRMPANDTSTSGNKKIAQSTHSLVQHASASTENNNNDDANAPLSNTTEPSLTSDYVSIVL